MIIVKKYRISDYVFEQLLELEYNEIVKLYAALVILEEDGITDAVLEKWGKGKEKKEYLSIPVSRTYIEGEPNGKIPKEVFQSIKIEISDV